VPKKPLARKSRSARPARGLARPRKRRVAKAVPRSSGAEGKLAFNHATIYVKDVERALHFYRDLLGLKPIEEFRFEGQPVYARLKAPGGEGTIALHQAGANDSVASDGVHLYFEVRDLDDFCRKLQKKNFFITRLPAMMPWGWRHAYLNDPDGHEISLYWAGEKRMKKTMQQVARKMARSRPSAG
jgi:catechol 2,3-dioxygenase-like lactoylglutathione lyase family enzyme